MDKYENKTLMILGAGQLQVPIIQRAKEKGLKVIVVSPGVDEPGFAYADIVVALDVKDEQGILRAAVAHKIDGITTDQTDLPVRTAAYVAEKMGLPGIGYDIGCLFTDKVKQRQRCRELGLPTPEFANVRTVAEAEAFFIRNGTSIIIKPADSQASHGVSKIVALSQIEACFHEAAKYSRMGTVLVEQWIEGTEFPADSYVSDGVCNLLTIGQYHPFSIEGVFSSYNTVWPANQPREVLELIRDTNKKIVEGFGLKQGRTHGEYIVSNGKCYLVEIGARGGGSFFSSDDIRYTTGFNSEDYLIDTALGLPTDELFGEKQRYTCCSTLFFYLPEGTVESIDGLEKVKSLDFVKRNNLDQIEIGMHTRPIIDKGARYFMIVTADSYEQLDEHIGIIRQTLRIVTLTKDQLHALPVWQ